MTMTSSLKIVFFFVCQLTSSDQHYHLFQVADEEVTNKIVTVYCCFIFTDHMNCPTTATGWMHVCVCLENNFLSKLPSSDIFSILTLVRSRSSSKSV